MSVRVVDKEALRQIFVRLSGLSDLATTWDLSPDYMVGDSDRAKISLKLLSLTSLGVDEHRRAFNPPGYPDQSFVVTEIGNRLVRITVRVEAFDADVEAAEIIDRLRTGVRIESVRDSLNTILLAFVEATPAIMLPTSYDTRVVSVAASDFTFGGIAQQVSDVEVNQGWIETVDGGGPIPGTIES